MKIFSQARDFNILDGDPDAIVCTAADWMSQQQRPEGNYFDGYSVHHREMTVCIQLQMINCIIPPKLAGDACKPGLYSENDKSIRYKI